MIRSPASFVRRRAMFLTVAMLILASLTPLAVADDPVRIDLARRAKLAASHSTPGDEFAPANAIDSNLATKPSGTPNSPSSGSSIAGSSAARPASTTTRAT